jgi:hypothetical protein
MDGSAHPGHWNSAAVPYAFGPVSPEASSSLLRELIDQDSEPLEQDSSRRQVAMETLGREEKHFSNLMIAENRFRA